MKRFYKVVSTKEEPDGFVVLLDGKPLKTPLKNTLLAPNEAVSDIVVQEWAGQGETIMPDRMVFTQILSTKIDRVSYEREVMSEAVFKYLDTDLVCYRAEHPPELLKRQEELWDPWLSWFENFFGESLQKTTDLGALTQPPGAHEAVRSHVQKLGDDHFTILQLVTSVAGSVVLGMAFTEKATTAKQVFEAIRIEEDYKSTLYNEELYGPDPAQYKKDEVIKLDLQKSEEFLSCL